MTFFNIGYELVYHFFNQVSLFYNVCFLTDDMFFTCDFETINEPYCFLEESNSDQFDFTRKTVRFLLVTVL